MFAQLPRCLDLCLLACNFRQICCIRIFTMHIDAFSVNTIYVSELPPSKGELERRQANPSLPSSLSQISSLSAQLALPTKIAAELTGVPSSVFVALGNPTALPALESQFIASPPAWFTTLPADAQAYILSVAPKHASVESQIISLEIAAGLVTTGGAISSTTVPTRVGSTTSQVAKSFASTFTPTATSSQSSAQPSAPKSAGSIAVSSPAKTSPVSASDSPSSSLVSSPSSTT